MSPTKRHEDIQTAINNSIQDLSDDELVKYVEKCSIEAEMKRRNDSEKLYEEQLKLALEQSKRESVRQSFFEKHFQGLNRININNGLDDQSTSIGNPYSSPVHGIASDVSHRSGSDSDSGFGSEERDLELAILRSTDPLEQHNEEMRDYLLALQLSKAENSPLDCLGNEESFDGKANSPEEKLWLYNEPDEVQILNDGYLLKQLEKDLVTPGTTQAMCKTERFFNDGKPPDIVSDGPNGVIPGVKTLDELEAEFGMVKRKKKAKKSSVSGSPSPTYSGDSSVTARQTSSPRPELGAIPKTKPKEAQAHPPARLKSWPKASPRVSPDLFQAPSRTVSGGRLGPPVQAPYRPIIVDGNNVAYQHGKNDRFSAKGMQIVYEYFVNKFDYQNKDIVIVHKPGGQKTLADLEIIENLYKIDVLIKTPRRHAGAKVIASDDDLFVLNLAKEKNGIVVSLDQFRDAYERTKDHLIKDVIEKRILQFVFKGDEIIFPNDPMGPRGPPLDKFLRF